MSKQFGFKKCLGDRSPSRHEQMNSAFSRMDYAKPRQPVTYLASSAFSKYQYVSIGGTHGFYGFHYLCHYWRPANDIGVI